MTTLASALLLAAALRGSLELGDRTEARFTGTTGPTTYSAEVMTNPSAILRLDTRRWELSARYAPSLTFRGLGLDPTLDLLHRGQLEASLEATRRLRARLFGEGTYGSVRFLSPELAGGDLAAAEPIDDTLPDADTVDFASLRAGAGIFFTASRRLTLDASAEYGLSGGIDAASEAAYPRIAGPRAEAGADFALTRRDSARSAVAATWVTFSTGEEAVVAVVTEAWRHRFTRRTSSTLAIGASFNRVRGSAGAGTEMVLYPVAEASLEHRLPPNRLELDFSVRVEPVIDRLRGTVDPRFLADASATWTPTPRLSIWGRAGVAQSIPWGEPDALTLAYGEAGAGVRLADWVELRNGARAATQVREETEPRRLQWMLFTGASFTAPRIRF